MSGKEFWDKYYDDECFKLEEKLEREPTDDEMQHHMESEYIAHCGEYEDRAYDEFKDSKYD